MKASAAPITPIATTARTALPSMSAARSSPPTISGLVIIEIADAKRGPCGRGRIEPCMPRGTHPELTYCLLFND
jgi:hypothetical protein